MNSDNKELQRFADFIAKMISLHEQEIKENLKAIKSSNEDFKKSV